jgi:hypothetical protein
LWHGNGRSENVSGLNKDVVLRVAEQTLEPGGWKLASKSNGTGIQ